MGFTFDSTVLGATDGIESLKSIPTIPCSTIQTDQIKDTVEESESEFKQTKNQKEINSTKTDKTTDKLKGDTIFVGNVPLVVANDKNKAREFLKLFSPFGKILSHRFRSIAFEMESKTWKRSAFLNQKFNSNLKSTINAYIVFESVDGKIFDLNGSCWENHHLRVDNSDNPKSLVSFRSIFVGNLPLDVSEEEVWSQFSDIGRVTNVRLVRDKMSQIGKGFGFIEFSDKGSVSLALKLKDLKIKDRIIRITSMKKSDSPALKRLHNKNKKTLKSTKKVKASKPKSRVSK